ncbi:MAG: chromosome segregation protein SMC [Acidobacteriia bacterium]|nr:chromosome segregation protein SMC [Methyloceanibacter sp.]MCL6490291.1 chromosome segregation protein SMC [Terriglobia bacterium]
MPVRFVRLKISGFKSFADPTVLEILPGLTGIVGPNGCGKSNVVDALRWVMGESSARSLRGGEMEDVIFSGTAHRPSRNLAEVTLWLEDAQGLAPPPFHEEPELEISRKIERGGTSSFRINRQEVRARDVQTLFADLASGARSSTIVSQGRVSALIQARPEERRGILEEAAGISGLHARRQEAEQKLRAAEANLVRADDLRGQMETQLVGLKRQARQANRYRNLSVSIRDTEAKLMALQAARLAAARIAAQERANAARIEVATCTESVRATSEQEQAASAALLPLREKAAEARAELERARLAEEQLAAEEQHAAAALQATEQRLVLLRRDIDHARQLLADATRAVERLDAEAQALAAEEKSFPAAKAALETEAEQAAAEVRVAEVAANQAAELAAEMAAQQRAQAKELKQAEAKAQRLREELAKLLQERARLQPPSAEELAAARSAQAQAEEACARLRAEFLEAEQARLAAQQALARARARYAEADAARSKLAAEVQGLAALLDAHHAAEGNRLVDALVVPPGLEKALGAALGEELECSTNPAAPRYWRELPPLAEETNPEPPAGTRPLADLVQAPPVLRRAFAKIAVLSDDCSAEKIDLKPGQTLVSREGGVWRWDGFTIQPGAPNPAAVRLEQRNRLKKLQTELTSAEEDARAARLELAAAEAREREAEQLERTLRSKRREAEDALERARLAVSNLAARASGIAAKLAAFDEQQKRLEAEQEETATHIAAARAALIAEAELKATQDRLQETQRALSAARSREAKSRAAWDALLREQKLRQQRRDVIAREQQNWKERAEDAEGRLIDLSARLKEAEAERSERAEAPSRLAAQRLAAKQELTRLEAAHREVLTALQVAERAAAEAGQAERAAEAALAQAREAMVRAEAQAEQAEREFQALAERIAERLGPNAALPELKEEATAEAEEQLRKRLEKLVREREEMGPVNLRAEIEANELENRIAEITREREEIAAAIAKLRHSIAHLNREGRERLTSVFTDVDRHFQRLFTQLFGGGKAHLAFVDSADPLTAGLEIYASPPGKKLATLSLLSGGEQALTALALIFAVFCCNPTPICVMDEVDAPLDDANIERLCSLLEHLARETPTSFLVVTHSHLTMARMDRLYGVTMQERGVSLLLSVDLGEAQRYAEQRPMAAE